MERPLALLILSCATAAAAADAPALGVAASAAPEAAPAELRAPEDVARLCRALLPSERVRADGDAVARGEAAVRHEAERDAALAGRYRVVVPGSEVRFAPFDAREGTLALAEGAPIRAAGGGARLWAADEEGLPVEVDRATARRILDAQARGTLALALTFALPDDATCGGGTGAQTFALAAEPVGWRWLDGDAPLAAGGADAERPLPGRGARPTVEVGDPLAGAPEARAAVAARTSDLQACYAEALKRDPVVDGILVARVGGDPAIAADSVGDAALADCVRRALGRVGVAGAVPIRFALESPTVNP